MQSESEAGGEGYGSTTTGVNNETASWEEELPRTVEDARKYHRRLVRDTQRMLLQWLVVLSVNFLTHFMRVSVVLIYCTRRFNVSEFTAGLMVTIHMLCLSVSNSYISYWIDHYPFEKLMLFRFCLLTMATLGEYLANSFWMFAGIYCTASFSVVWFGVQPAYIIQMLPPQRAKGLANLGALLNQGGIMLGIGVGGVVGGLTTLRTVFLTSFIVSVTSLLFIILVVRGKETKLKWKQSNIIAFIYRRFPLEFLDKEQRFPMPFIEEFANDSFVYTSGSSHNHCIVANNNNAGGGGGSSSSNKSMIINTQLESDDFISSNNSQFGSEIGAPSQGGVSAAESSALIKKVIQRRRNESNDSNSDDYSLDIDEDSMSLFTVERIPFWIFIVMIGLQAASLTEFAAWWNVYCNQRWDSNIALSNAQIMASIGVSFTFTGIIIGLVKPRSFKPDRLLNVTLVLSLLTGALSFGQFWFWFPMLGFSEFWYGIAVKGLLTAIVFPFYVVVQVLESPPKKAGLMFSVNVGARSLLPAVQHVIIGSLWNIDDHHSDKHPWFFRWFAILYGCTSALYVLYYCARKWVNSRRKGRKNDSFSRNCAAQVSEAGAEGAAAMLH